VTCTGPIRVCFVSPKAYALFNPQCGGTIGGAEVDSYLLATELAKDDAFRVSFIVADYGQPRQEQIEGVTVFKSLRFGRNSLAGAYRLWRAMSAADADIYFLKTASPGVPLAATFCKLHGRILAYRTASARESDGRYRNDHPFLGAVFESSLRRAGAVFTQNTTDRDKLKTRTGIESIFVLNGHRIDSPDSGPRDSVLWAGRSEDVKKPGLFIDLAARLPAYKFIMICQRATIDVGYEKLKEQAAHLKNIEFIEHVPFDKMAEYFRRAAVLVNTSDSEGFPNAFIQACAAGSAILSLNVNPDGFLEKFNCGLCCRGNFDKMAALLKAMLENKTYIDLGVNGRRYAEANHDIAKIINVYKDVFKNLVKRAGPCAE
jgi:glycosyltransferase involved in cell wall biosynthesis